MHEGFTVFNLLKRAITIAPNTEIVYNDHRQTYRETYERVIGLANSLLSLGISKGTVIGVADFNTHRYVELLYASSLIGSIIYPVNIRLPPEQIIYTLKHANVEWLFLSKDFIALSKYVTDPKKVIGLDTNETKIVYDDLITKKFTKEPEIEITGNDPYSILYTSGTTGLPKAVIYTNEKTVWGALSMVYQLGLYNAPAKLDSNDVIFPLIPFYHIWAWGSLFHASFLGAKYVLGGKFDPSKTLELIRKEKVTWINAVPTMIHMLLSHPNAHELKGLKLLIGGMPIPINLARKINDTGIKFSSIYGGTDMLAISISIIPKDIKIDDIIDYLRITTHPVPFVDTKIIKMDGTIAGPNEIGELYVKAPWLPGEYYKDPEKTKTSYENGWFKTGDIALITPEHGIRILDRVKDVIKSGGEWIPTSILESIISEIPQVDMAAIIGKPDEKYGERPIAIIKPRTSTQITQEEIIQYLRKAADNGRIAKWWIPEQIIIVEDIPLTSTGKINKLYLKQKYT
jgi:acyl-CoA synthetase (AMP-forming)/AMP-acid ligase II